MQTAAKQNPEQQRERKTRTWACHFKNLILFLFSCQAERTYKETSWCVVIIPGFSANPYQVRGRLGLSVFTVGENEKDLLYICDFIYFLKMFQSVKVV